MVTVVAKDMIRDGKDRQAADGGACADWPAKACQTGDRIIQRVAAEAGVTNSARQCTSSLREQPFRLSLKRAAIMFNPDTNSAVYMPSFERAARSLKVEPITAPVRSDVEIETAIIALGRERGGGLVSMTGGFIFAHRAQIISAATRNNVPA
jgi:hypothetical protein